MYYDNSCGNNVLFYQLFQIIDISYFISQELKKEAQSLERKIAQLEAEIVEDKLQDGSDVTTLCDDDDDAEVLGPSQPSPAKRGVSSRTLVEETPHDSLNDDVRRPSSDVTTRTQSQSLLTQRNTTRKAMGVRDTESEDVDVIRQTPESQSAAVTVVPETMEDLTPVEPQASMRTPQPPPRIGSLRLTSSHKRLDYSNSPRDVTPRRKPLQLVQGSSPSPASNK